MRPRIDVNNSAQNTTEVEWAEEARRQAFVEWLAAIAERHGLQSGTLCSASNDASFRRYLRLRGADERTFIVMDAPPPLEDVRPFIHVAEMVQRAGLHGPLVLERQVEHGFLLLSDLGTQPYLQALQDAVARGDTGRADTLMRDASAALVQWQLRADPQTLPAYDDALLRRELALFPDWCVGREMGVTWSGQEQQQWQAACDLLVASALDQPAVAVHRDYMPRNLMVCEPNPGILDFQDAVRGP